MKRNEIKAEVDETLRKLGFKAKQFKWAGCEVSIVLGGEFVTMRFPSGMSKRALAFEMGRLTGWVDMLGTDHRPVAARAPKANGHIEAHP